jgi:hypothetical protein
MAPWSFIGRMKVKVWVKARGEVVSKRGSQVVRRIFRMDEMVLRACPVEGCRRMRCSCWVGLRFGLQAWDSSPVLPLYVAQGLFRGTFVLPVTRIPDEV